MPCVLLRTLRTGIPILLIINKPFIMRFTYPGIILFAGILFSCGNGADDASKTTIDSSVNSNKSTKPETIETLADGQLKTPPKDTIFGTGDRVSSLTVPSADTVHKSPTPAQLKEVQELLSKLATIQAVTIIDDDVQVAYSHILWAWGDNGPCTRFILCATYIGNFEIKFSDGDLGFSRIVQRLTTSAHDCIANAKKALLGPHGDGNNPDRGLAVAWVMASQIHNRPVYEWQRTHGDAVIKALSQIH